jgi:exosortase
VNVQYQELSIYLSSTIVGCLFQRPTSNRSGSHNSPFALRTHLVSSRPVQNLASPHKLTDASPQRRGHSRAPVVLSVLFLAALWFGLCRELSGEWSVNEQYNFGWFVPFFALYLFWLRWQDRPAVQIPNPKSQIPDAVGVAIAIAALLLLLPVRLFEIANPEWRLLAWLHAAAAVTLTLLLIWWAGGDKWLRHLAFPVAFMFVAVPWPTSLEAPVIQGLMRTVAGIAAETTMLLGTPAQVEGNLIRVSNGLVGVNEACSGIRSLQTSLMIGLLFGEIKRLSVSRRVALAVCAVVIALFANFMRAVFLVRVAATENLSAVARWHDIAGYSIIALVFLATMALTYFFAKSETRKPKGESRSRKSVVTAQWSVVGNAFIAAALCWLLFVETGAATWYRVHERNLISGIRWNVHWPEQGANFRKLKIDEEIRAVLRFDYGEAATWTIDSRANAIGKPTAISCSLFVFRWNPGKNSAVLANLHRPDVCLPASGWTQVADDGVGAYPVNGSFELPFRHFEFQRTFDGSAPQIAHAFYCLSEDRVSEPSTTLARRSLGGGELGMFGNHSEWTRAERLRSALEGRRHLGQQVIEAIFISNEPLSAAEAETHLRDVVRDVVRVR